MIGFASADERAGHWLFAGAVFGVPKDWLALRLLSLRPSATMSDI